MARPTEARHGDLRPAHLAKVRGAGDVANEAFYLVDKAERIQGARRTASKDVFATAAGLGESRERSDKIESVHPRNVFTVPAQYGVLPALRGADAVTSGPSLDPVSAEPGIYDVAAGAADDKIRAVTRFQARTLVDYYRQGVRTGAADETTAAAQPVAAPPPERTEPRAIALAIVTRSLPSRNITCGPAALFPPEVDNAGASDRVLGDIQNRRQCRLAPALGRQ